MKRQQENYPYYNTRRVNDLKQLVNEAAELYGNKELFVYRRNKEIVSKSFIDFKNDINYFGTALVSQFGFSEEHMAIVAENSYEWLVVYFTAIISHGVFVPIDRELPPEGIANILKISDSSILVVSDNFSVKLADVIPTLDFIKTKIIIGKEKEGYFSFEKLLEIGKEQMEAGNTDFVSLVPITDTLSSLVFTSGTTGTAKGVMLTQANIVSTAINALDSIHIGPSAISVLPYNHTYESTTGILCYVHEGRTIYINESLRMFANNLKEYKPTDMQCVPLIAESLYKKIWSTAEETGKDKTLKKALKISRFLMKHGIDIRRKLFKSVLEGLGGNLSCMICGGAAVKPNIGEFFYDIGITVLVGYGITECSPLVSANRNYFFDFASAGVPIRGCSVKIDSPDENGEGEICVKGENVMMGYYKNPEATANAFKDGWFLTGDIGKIDDKGRIYITGRKKNLIVLKNGKNVYPEEIESYFDESRNIAEIVVYAIRDESDHEAAITAEIFPNMNNVTEDHPLEKVREDIRAEIEEVNKKLPMYKQIKNVTFRDKEFDKTSTKKIKRFAVGQKKA